MTRFVNLILVLFLLNSCKPSGETSLNIKHSDNRNISKSTHNAVPKNINKTTSRYKRTSYMCEVATKEKMKPSLKGLDNFLMSDGLFAYADLYGDGTLDLIAGNYDEAYENKNLMGNDLRSRKPHQYMFFSPNPNFKVPENTQFIMARVMLVQDFNGDGIDDVVFVQHGPDYKPYIKQNNKILLSNSKGYIVKTLPGPAALHHGGSAGDIDRDGDIDLVITPGKQSRVIYLLNDGKGNFSYRVFLGNNGNWRTNKRYYNTFLWDLDKDGYLDLVLDGGIDPSGKKDLPPVIHWGKKKSSFTSPFEIKGEILDPHIYGGGMQDAIFSDIDNDGHEELVFLNSDPKTKNDIKNNYYGFSLSAYNVSGRNISKPRILASYTSETSYFLWLARFSECDINNDGDIDLVYESHGERYWAFGGYINPDTHQWGVDKLLWLNNGKGEFSLKKVFDPQYWHKDEKVFIENEAKRLGVSVSKYKQNKVYYPTNDGNVYFKRTIGYPIMDNQRKYLNLPKFSEKLTKAPLAPQSSIDYSNYRKPIKVEKPTQTKTFKTKPRNNYLIKLNKLCNDAISGNDWSKINIGSVEVAKERGYTVQTCKIAIKKCKELNCIAK